MWLYPEVRTLGEFVRYWARQDPARAMLRRQGRVVTFGEGEAITSQLANFLIEKGAEAGDLVGYLGKNSFDFYFALFGCGKTRSGLVVFNWRLSPAELLQQIEDSGARLILIEADMAPLWEAVAPDLSSPIEGVWFDDDESLEQLASAHSAEAPAVDVIEDDVAFQLYTSGTTGRPKGVMLSHRSLNMMRLSEHFEPAYHWERDDSFINALPNFHLLHIGIALQCIYNGVSIVPVRQFEPALVLEAISTLHPTLLTLTPTMLQMLLDHPAAANSDFSSLRLTLYAGSPISLGLIQRAISAMPCRFMQFYGSTEAGGASSILRPDEHDLEHEEKLKSCGRPLPLIAFKIVDAEGREVPVGEAGELMIRQPSITKGYWRQPETTAAVLKDGWYRSGDIARQDADGLYYIVDRAKDMIVSGGENIYSAEVENILSVHPGVAAVAVIGVPDPRWGEAVKAVVVAKVEWELSEAALIEFCRERLAGYKVPKSIDFVDAFPLVPSGKVSKKDLRQRYWSGHGRGVA
jgi:acyl-CoA synthetase (AMP-forming)/AMP-acid ligase II